MSFLLPEDDPRATLEEAFALIDACEYQHYRSSDASSSTTASTASSVSSDEDVPSLNVFIHKTANGRLQTQQQPCYQQQLTQLTAKVAASANSRARSVKKHRERKKNETQLLRKQAKELEARLTHHQRVVACRREREARRLRLIVDTPRSSTEALICNPDGGAQSWFDVATMQAIERFESEALNLRLRDALVRQEQLTKSLVGLLSQTRAEGLELLLDRHKQELVFDRFPKVKKSPPVSVMDDLLASLQQMYVSTDSVLKLSSKTTDWTGGATSTLTHVAQDDLLAGACIEVTISAVVNSDFQQVGQAIWQRMFHPPTDDHGILAIQTQELTSESFHKSYDLVVDLPNQQQPSLKLHGTSYLHKFDEDGRFMIMWTAYVALPSGGAQLTEKSWIVVVPDASASGAICKTVYQVSCAPQGPTVSIQTKEQIASVLKSLSRKKREYLEMMQEMFLDEFAGTQHLSSPPIEIQSVDVN